MQIVAVVVTASMLGVVLELVPRRRLVERYALLWITVAVALLVLAIWRDLLSWAADLLGIDLPSNALFLVAFGVAFLLLLHFSIATSRLSEETKILAQEVARLDAEAPGRAPGSRTAERRPRKRREACEAAEPGDSSRTPRPVGAKRPSQRPERPTSPR